MHRVEKVHKCNQCEYATSHSMSLVAHIRTHNGEKPYMCNQCNFASSHANGLRQHTKIHSGERSHKCNQCKFAFSQSSGLARHMRSHHGKNPYKCNHCEFVSSHAKGLRQHVKTHSGESHKCNQCKFTTSQEGKLRIHMQRHCTTIGEEKLVPWNWSPQDSCQEWQIATLSMELLSTVSAKTICRTQESQFRESKTCCQQNLRNTVQNKSSLIYVNLDLVAFEWSNVEVRGNTFGSFVLK